MSRIYDNWERLVEATLKREQFRLLALADSVNSSFRSNQSEHPFIADDAEAFESSSYTDSEPDSNSYFETSSLERDKTEASISLCPAVQHVAFKELKEATKNFRSDLLIGRGGFGDIYKGWIHEHTLTAAKPGKGMAVAIKLWADGSLGRTEWLNEIHYLRQLHHPNLVKLIGYSFEDVNLLLVYEFMLEGSLDHHLFKGKHQMLSWATRINIAVGVAKGLCFLHDEKINVIHRVVAPSSILLDEEFNAKLCAFGLARDGPVGDGTHISTRVMGVIGYIAPEYAMAGHLTPQCDVYGFGVVLLELLTGCRAIDIIMGSKDENFVEWLKPYLHNKEMLFKIMDTKLKGQYTQKGAHTIATIALHCLSLDPKVRPPMTEVLAALEPLQSGKTWNLKSRISQSWNPSQHHPALYNSEQIQ